MELASKLTALRTFRYSHKPRMTLRAAGELVGVSKVTWHRWEEGQRKVDPELVPLVSEKTGISAAELRPDLALTFGEAAE